MRVPARLRKIGGNRRSGGSPNDFLTPRRYHGSVMVPLDLLGAGWVRSPSIDCGIIFGNSHQRHGLC
jgi:hypothetical protein